MSNIIQFPYNGSDVRFDLNGWINATDVAKRFEKNPYEWLRLPDTITYLDALARHLNTGKSRNLIRTSRGRNGGTWLHPKLAVHFSRWLDADFAVWCDMHIDAILRGDVNPQMQYDNALAALNNQKKRGSMAASELAKHRWNKPPLEQRVEYWKEQLQLKLDLPKAN